MPMPIATEPSDSKLKELILYVAKRSQDDIFYGATKLNKILFFSDFLAFKKLGRAITGQPYRKLEFGPAPVRLPEIREELIRNGDAAAQDTVIAGNLQHRLVHLRDPKLAEFSGEEIAVVDEIIDLLRSKTATEVSEFSHRFVGWQIAREGQVIPYETVYIVDRPLTEKENAYAMTLKPTLKDGVK
jgi:hypothetical protein